MTQISDGQYRGAALYADFSESRPNQIVDAPLNFAEVRELTSAATRLEGMVMEATPRKLYVFFPEPANALQMARRVAQLVASARDTDLSRLGLDARVILGHGAVVIEQARVKSDWTFRLAGLVSAVPQNGVAGLRDFVAQFRPGEIMPPPRPSARSDLFILPMVDNESTENQETRLAGLGTSTDGVFLVLTLRVRGVPQTFRSSDCPILIGRDKSCGVQVSGEKSSRVHGRIEFEKEKFYYVDDSRNGTYVLTGGGQELLIKNEKIVLAGEGAISPGAPLSTQTGEVVRYSCTPSRLSMAGDAGSDGDTKMMRTEQQ
ncbi:FHA domain-containing protein [Solimonas sp. K1W22B-7]|uniref:FHA domain-containing protein n=1 Tax=Solimonas sp. K1W22B-7 TaxID=2303331 RepID=UPI000E32DE01|nr:FHA domain-containing protein [Solimonas sp. K1W22B-7]AXQ27904.1 FHA domain-containing protein [Solimonas sp. K1W22B-7]